jgi:hypothetical protein
VNSAGTTRKHHVIALSLLQKEKELMDSLVEEDKLWN